MCSASRGEKHAVLSVSLSEWLGRTNGMIQNIIALQIHL
jgi:hypothetical protein